MLPIDKQMLFLLTRVPKLSSARFVEIYTARGYSAQSIRNILSRLKQECYIESPERSNYAITEFGRRTLHAVANKGFRYQEEWDGQWHLVTFEIPESIRSKRYQLKGLLTSLGFAALYGSTYISPWNYTGQIAQLVDQLELQPHVTQIRGALQPFTLTREQAGRLWDLDKVRSAQEQKWEWFQQTWLQEVKRNIASGDALQLFIRYLELGEEMGELVILDPMLPPDFLPEGWRGSEMLGTFYTHFSSLHRDVPKEEYFYPLMVE